jgi:endo-1,4-beta-xylanase
MKKRIPAFIAAVVFILATIITTGAENLVITSNTNGPRRHGNFNYEFWSQYNDGGKMTITGETTFTCEWADAFNILFRMGRHLGSVRPYTYYGNITIEYEATHNILAGDVAYLCIYGWTQNPLIEFYVVENRASYNPGSAGVLKGVVEIDGGLYEIFEATRTNQPSIEGTRTFKQYFSVRIEGRTSGTVSLHEHFKAWESFGMDMSGNLYEVSLCVEGFGTGSRGNAEISKHILTIGDNVWGAPSPLSTTDALNILRHVAGVSALTNEQRARYGLGSDITAADALAVLRTVAGLR